MASSFPLASSPSPLPSTSISNTGDSFNESDTEGSTVTVSLEDDFEDRTIKAVRVDYNEFFELPTQPNTNAKCVGRCKQCRKSYKYTLTSKGNLLSTFKPATVEAFVFIKNLKRRQLKIVKYLLTRVLFIVIKEQ